MAGKSFSGNYFEDFRLGQDIVHAVPRTVTSGDVALYGGLYGMRFPLQSSDTFARSVGLARSPIDNLLAFHLVFGKTVADISLNAIANLGYADCRFLKQVYPGDTLHARSRVIGLRENATGKTGIVYVRSTGLDQHGDPVLSFVRWVMVAKRDIAAPPPETFVPDLPGAVAGAELAVPGELTLAGYDFALAGSSHRLADYEIGERIDHIDGMTVEDAEHQIATRLYQNTARVHFDARMQRDSRFGRRLVYGGHVMSLARSLSFNGLANVMLIPAINGGRHVGPLAAGDTVYCWSQILDRYDMTDRTGVGALRIRTVATRDVPCECFPEPAPDNDNVVLDLDYWGIVPA